MFKSLPELWSNNIILQILEPIKWRNYFQGGFDKSTVYTLLYIPTANVLNISNDFGIANNASGLPVRRKMLAESSVNQSTMDTTTNA